MANKKTMIEGFWDRFGECIKDTGDNCVEMGNKLGCNRKVLYNDYDNRAPRSQVVMKFCANYGVSLGYLCGISKEKEGSVAELKVVNGFWDRFYELIEETGESKISVAKRIGCDRKTLMASGATEAKIPNLLYIARFCTTYNYSPEYLLGTTNNKRAKAA